MNEYGIEVDKSHGAHIGELIRVHRPHLLGNPFSHRRGTDAQVVVGSRLEAVHAHRTWLWQSGQAGAVWQELWRLALLINADGTPRLLTLRCACTGDPCHADTLAHAVACIRHERQMRKVIAEFRGRWSDLSNFSAAEVHLDGELYPTVEHAFQAAKSLSPEVRACVRAAPTAAQAKRIGRHVELRADWEAVKVVIMRDLLARKFMWPVHSDVLAATEDRVLVEGNTWGDHFWGVCAGRGENMLGALLMSIRDGHRGILSPRR